MAKECFKLIDFFLICLKTYGYLIPKFYALITETMNFYNAMRSLTLLIHKKATNGLKENRVNSEGVNELLNIYK